MAVYGPRRTMPEWTKTGFLASRVSLKNGPDHVLTSRWQKVVSEGAKLSWHRSLGTPVTNIIKGHDPASQVRIIARVADPACNQFLREFMEFSIYLSNSHRREGRENFGRLYVSPRELISAMVFDGSKKEDREYAFGLMARSVSTDHERTVAAILKDKFGVSQEDIDDIIFNAMGGVR